MPYAITNRCIKCDQCIPICPSGAIRIEQNHYWIDPRLCNSCDESSSGPPCVSSCPVSSPVPLQAKKGRYKLKHRGATSPSLFANEKDDLFASAIIVWELCNVLAQRDSLPWQTNPDGLLCYQRQVNQGRGLISFYVTDQPVAAVHQSTEPAIAQKILEALDIRAACMHLIFAAHATSLNQPWTEEFIVSDQQIEDYLGLEKRRDLSKLAKLSLIKDLVLQSCTIQAHVEWPQQGRIPGFSIPQSPLWHIVEIKHHFQEDDLGCKHLMGLTFHVRPGIWAKYFLNQQGYRDRTAFYQYGTLPKSLLGMVMSAWQQHEGAVRIMLWLLFKAKMGKEQRITIPTLMRIAYGEEKLAIAHSQREGRKRLLRTFESDLEVLNHYGLKPVFDPITYPSEIQPLWAKLAELPDDAEEALEFWMEDGSSDSRLTDAAPRGKWKRLMKARLLHFELPADWNQQPSKRKKKKRRKTFRKININPPQPHLSGQQVAIARKRSQLSQRALAEQLGKSQSWVRDIENGRLKVNPRDQTLLCKVLGIV